MLFCFFSSRRRHTRWPRDWSSDVCSSDLPPCTRCGHDAASPRESWCVQSYDVLALRASQRFASHAFESTPALTGSAAEVVDHFPLHTNHMLGPELLRLSVQFFVLFIKYNLGNPVAVTQIYKY